MRLYFLLFSRMWLSLLPVLVYLNFSFDNGIISYKKDGYYRMIASIIVSIISVIGSFVLVFLSSIRDTFERKYTIRREQLDKFYIPFYQTYCAGF